jgi:serine/threonine protein kinase
MQPTSPEPMRGTLLGPWRVLEHVGSGSNGLVYRVCLAERPDEGFFALKLAREPRDFRFEREAELLSRLKHPHIPGLRDRGAWRDGWERERLYLVMQWVDGVPLYDWAVQRQLTSRQVLRLVGQLARALEATHRHGTHRDVKGDNVLVGADGNAVLVDYGCCWYPGARPLTDLPVPPGTPTYRSPECLRFQYRHRRDRDTHYVYPPEDDLYALGVTAYRLVTGIYPPPGTDPECADDPRRPRPPKRLAPSAVVTVHPVLEAIIERLLSEEKKARGTATELAKACEKAARSAGAEADLPLQPSRSAPPMEKEKATLPGPAREDWLPKQAPWFIAGVATATAVGLLLALLSRRHGFEELEDEPPSLLAEEEEQPDAGVMDERVVGVADAGVEDGLASVVDTSIAGIDLARIGREIPHEPMKGQRKPPCIPRREKEIRGACWVRIGDMEAPCGNDFEWEGRCYIPSLITARQPTSDGER